MPAGGSPGLLTLATGRENAVSSAILYLAIIAIWAGILVPRWLRRSHDAPGTAEDQSGEGSQPLAESGSHAEAMASAHVDAAVHADAAVHEHDAAVEHGVAFEYDAAFEYGAVHADGTAYEYETAVEYGSAVEYDAVLEDSAADRGGADQNGAGVSGAGDSADDDDTEPALTLRGRPLWSEGPGWHPLGRRRDRPRPAVTRASALQARRRMLTTLVTLTIAALALTTLHMAPWWIIVPPAGTLGLLLLVLREAARADAEAADRAAEARAAHEARLAARRASEAQAAAAPEPTAEIIDISARVSDQLYDQYADAAVRAVGD